jgi:hypothetical protein
MFGGQKIRRVLRAEVMKVILEILIRVTLM